jgi:hypothetical protein
VFVAPALVPHLASQPLVNLNPGAIFAPLVEVVVNALPGGILFGQVTPLAACHRHIQNGIDDLLQVQLAGPAPFALAVFFLLHGKQSFDMFPLTFSQIAGVNLRFHNPNLHLNAG